MAPIELTPEHLLFSRVLLGAVSVVLVITSVYGFLSSLA